MYLGSFFFLLLLFDYVHLETLHDSAGLLPILNTVELSNFRFDWFSF